MASLTCPRPASSACGGPRRGCLKSIEQCGRGKGSVMKPGHKLQRSLMETALHPTSQHPQVPGTAFLCLVWEPQIPGPGRVILSGSGMKAAAVSPSSLPRWKSGCSSSGCLGRRRSGHLEGRGDPVRAQLTEITKQGAGSSVGK